jgi:hypothetical protein
VNVDGGAAEMTTVHIQILMWNIWLSKAARFILLEGQINFGFPNLKSTNYRVILTVGLSIYGRDVTAPERKCKDFSCIKFSDRRKRRFICKFLRVITVAAVHCSYW